MKLIALGDTHGTTFWKYVVNTQTFDKLVFVGDYFDSFDISWQDQLKNFLDIMAYKQAHPEDVVCLIGNHDYHYFPFIGDRGTSGYMGGPASVSIGYELNKHLGELQMTYQHEEFLFTHAGVTPTWMERCLGEEAARDIPNLHQHINDLWRYRPYDFDYKMLRFGQSTYGDDIWQSPIWVRPRSLMADAQDYKKSIIQVVGHTHQSQIDIKGKATGGRYYFIDTLGSSREYLVIENGQVKAEVV